LAAWPAPDCREHSMPIFASLLATDGTRATRFSCSRVSPGTNRLTGMESPSPIVCLVQAKKRRQAYTKCHCTFVVVLKLFWIRFRVFILKGLADAGKYQFFCVFPVSYAENMTSCQKPRMTSQSGRVNAASSVERKITELMMRVSVAP